MLYKRMTMIKQCELNANERHNLTNLESSTTSSFVPKRILVKFNFFISCFTQTSATKTHLEVSPLEYWQRDLFEELQHGGPEAESKDLGPLDPFEALQAFQLLQASLGPLIPGKASICRFAAPLCLKAGPDHHE